MYIVVAAFFTVLVVLLFLRALKKPNAIHIFSATIGVFSVGYYILPLFFRGMTTLRRVTDQDVQSVAFMSLLYFICLLGGLELVKLNARKVRPLKMDMIDDFSRRHWWMVTIIASIIYITYINTANLTSYASADFNAYFEKRSPLAGITAFFSSLSLGLLAVNFAIALRNRRWIRVSVLMALLFYIEIKLLGAGQRLIFITPLLTIFSSFVAARQYRTSAIALGAGVFALLVISPFAVALREARGSSSTANVSAVSVNYRTGVVETTLQSILDRADLLYVMVHLKRHVDSHGFVGPKFYTSVLAIPIPRAIYPKKPYVLSDTGRADGEASILAWHLMVGPSNGSLTAFGSIVAYRTGGWVMVVIDGIAAGILFALALTSFGNGGVVGRALFAVAFVNWSVRKVPPSFFEAMVDVMTYLPVVVILIIINSLLSSSRQRRFQTRTYKRWSQ